MDQHILWVEKYRPKTVKECILPESLKETFQEYLDYINKYEQNKDKWIYNIIDGISEQDKIIYRDEFLIVILTKSDFVRI